MLLKSKALRTGDVKDELAFGRLHGRLIIARCGVLVVGNTLAILTLALVCCVRAGPTGYCLLDRPCLLLAALTSLTAADDEHCVGSGRRTGSGSRTKHCSRCVCELCGWFTGLVISEPRSAALSTLRHLSPNSERNYE